MMRPGLIHLTIVAALMIGWSTAVFPLTQIDRPFSQLVDLADAILVGTVDDASTEWGQGQLANTIFTVVTLNDLDVIKGDVQGATYDLRYAGGRIGDLIHSYKGIPRLTVGTRYLLFISSEANALFPVVGIGQGVFIVARDSGEPTETIQTVSGRDVLGILGDQIYTTGPREPVTFDQFAICIEDQMNGIPPESCRPAWAGTKLYSLGFESSGWEAEFTGQSTWGDHLARTSNAPHSGSYSLRGNQISGKIDGITGLPGIANTGLDWRGGGDILSRSRNELYLSYWFRHDDYNHRLEDDGSGEGKLLWFVDDTYGIQAMFINNMLAGSSQLRLNYSNGGYSDAWASTNWGFTSLFLSNPNVSGGTDGEWVHFEYYINYTESYIRIWVDGHIMKSSKHGDPAYPKLPPDGRIYYDSGLDLRTKGFQFFWVRSSNIDSSTDGSGYSAGWQIDDLEVWGRP